jgi:hypothetical protein
MIAHLYLKKPDHVHQINSEGAGINMGFAFLVENCNVSQRRRLVGVIGNGF